ncbi:tetratricopeptide repeat protein [Candidatus Peregrinibacteria bacterium]|nr:tetratricopeptide repeat protein [Candidatus Peregrinibacteria bacterium]
MIEIILMLIALLVLVLIYFRRWYLLEKGQLFGKMVLKKGHNLPPKLTKEDHEVTVKEMIPAPETIDPKLVIKGDAFYKKAELALKRGQNEEAEKLYIQAISMNPAHIDSHAKLGMIYLNQESMGKAELIYRKLIIAEPEEASYFSNLALTLFHQDKLDESKGFYERSIELDDKRPGRYYSLSRVNYALGDFDNAVLNIQKALALDPDNVDYGLTLAHWYLEKGMQNDTSQLINEILKHWPDNQDALEIKNELEKGGDVSNLNEENSNRDKEGNI